EALRDGFFADTTVLSSAKERAFLSYMELNPAQAINQPHMRRLEDLMAKSKAKGIHLVFVLSPRVYAPDLLAMMQQLPAEHKIDLSDPRKFPEFYQAKYSFDDMHLNHQGAMCYTESLASALQNIMSIQNIRLGQK
ncbi:MAG: hypothetical protein AAGD28_31675, partial [Bacteroidota bacterium]